MFDLSTVNSDLDPVNVVAHLADSNGVQALWRFANGRGASVIQAQHSYGVELAVTRYVGEGVDDFTLDYTTSLTDDVIGWIDSPERLLALLTEIKDLPHVRHEIER